MLRYSVENVQNNQKGYENSRTHLESQSLKWNNLAAEQCSAPALKEFSQTPHKKRFVIFNKETKCFLNLHV